MKTIPRAIRLSLLSLLCLPAMAVDGGVPLPDYGAGYLSFYLDNDLFAGSDRDYTNGARLTWVSANLPPDKLPPVQRYLRHISGDPASFDEFQRITGFRDPSAIQYNYGFSLTQLMYTPEDPEPYGQPAGQRRYAGWSALGFSLHAKDDRILNSIELSIGTTGPHAYAENTQDFIHDLKGDEKFNGWDDQIPNELTVDLSYVQKRRIEFFKYNFGAFRADAVSEWGARLGTFRTGAHIGSMIRAGINLPPDFSDARLSDTAYSHKYYDSNDPYTGDWSFYVLAGFVAKGVLHDATLDGPLFSDFRTGNSREPFVADVYAGFGVRYRDLEISYVQTSRTDEYKEEKNHIEYGSLVVHYRF